MIRNSSLNDTTKNDMQTKNSLDQQIIVSDKMRKKLMRFSQYDQPYQDQYLLLEVN